MNHRPILLALLTLIFLTGHGTLHSQLAGTLKYSVPPPGLVVQPQAGLGYSVAADASFIALGAPYDDTGGFDFGVVKVFDATSGALLHVLRNPKPGSAGSFGWAVAISAGRLVVGAPDDDAAYVFNLSGATPTVPVLTVTTPNNPAAGTFGAAVAISGLRVVVGDELDDTGATDAGSVFVFQLGSATPTMPVAVLSNPSPAVGDKFGAAVAVSGANVVAGVPADDTGASNAGLAYLFNLAGATPTVPVGTFADPVPTANGSFGQAVALNGPLAAVGAPSSGASGSGEVFAYDIGSATPFTAIHTLPNPAPGTADAFGASVAVSGNGVVVGSRNEDVGATDAGSAYVFDLSSGTPTVPFATLDNPGPAASDNFGNAVAISGDRVVVGCRYDDIGADVTGAGYVYDMTGPTPAVPVLSLFHASPISGDRFGYAVAVSGARMVVGAPREDTGASDAGSAYLYDLSGGTPTVPVVTLNNPSPGTGENFGTAVAISGTRVVVGAPDDGGGIAYVYDLTSATPGVPAFTLNNPTPVVGDAFGWAAGISGTLVVIGAPGNSSGLGGAYVYDLASATPTVPMATLSNPSPETDNFDFYANFGYSVAISGTRIVVAAPFDDNGANDAGRAYVFDTTSATPTVPVATLNNPGPLSGDYFGRAVSISGTRVLVAAINDDTGATNAGSAYLYDLSSPAPATPTLILNNPAPATNDAYGSSVSLSGPLALIGAYADDAIGADAGSAYVYDITRATPTVPLHTFTKPGATADSPRFGIAVALDGTTAVIGADEASDVVWEKGYAYVFGPSTTLTLPPTLTAPASSVVLAPGTVSVAFSLPENALPGSVKLAFQNGATGRVLTLAASQETSGAHSFTFSQANPTASPEIASGAALPDGIYTVALSYQDALGSGAATSNAATGVVLDVTAPTIAAPPGGFTPPALVAPATLPDYRAQAVTFDAAGIATLTQTPAPGTALATGLHNITITATDYAGHTASTTFGIHVLSFTQDTDGDGLNDASELQLVALGFDWQMNQTALVNTLMSNANGAGLYTTSQVQALYVGTPLISKSPTTGLFKLTIGVEKSANLQTFTPFPMTAPQTLINGTGELEFYFTVPDNTAFFQIRAE